MKSTGRPQQNFYCVYLRLKRQVSLSTETTSVAVKTLISPKMYAKDLRYNTSFSENCLYLIVKRNV